MIDWIRQRLHLPERPPARPLPLDHQQAGDIVSLCGGQPSQHQIMQQNVANYLAHMRTLGDELPAEALRDQKSLQKAVSQGMVGHGGQQQVAEKLRWRSKLQREIQFPYRDNQVGVRLHECVQDLKSVLAPFAPFPHQVYLVGGPLGQREGRFGGNSDLDVVMKVQPEGLAQAQSLVAQLGREGADRKHTFELHVTSPEQFPEVERYFGASVELNETKLGTQVEGIVRDGLGAHGLAVDEHWEARRREWSPPATLVAPTPFPRTLVTTLKG